MFYKIILNIVFIFFFFFIFIFSLVKSKQDPFFYNNIIDFIYYYIYINHQ